MTKKTYAFILSSSPILAGSVARFIGLVHPSFEPIILNKTNGVSHPSIVDMLREKHHKDCMFIIASDNSSEWFQWLYDIRCKRKFRGPCCFLFAESPLTQATAQSLFANYIKSHQDMLHYTRIFHMLSNVGTVKSGLTYNRLKRIQRNVRRRYLNTAHF